MVGGKLGGGILFRRVRESQISGASDTPSEKPPLFNSPPRILRMVLGNREKKSTFPF